MSKITRAFQKIFGGSLTPSGNIAVFGSLAAGSPAYSNDPVVIQSLAAYTLGWAAATIGNNSPALQDDNALNFLFSRQLAYLFQSGIAEWNAQTTYYQNSLCTSSDTIYQSKTNDNLNNAVTDTNNWRVLISPNPRLGEARAWVTFQPNGTILSSYNVSSITNISGGVYGINFTTAMPNANYCVQLTASTRVSSNISAIGCQRAAIPPTVSSCAVQFVKSENGDAISPDRMYAVFYAG